jgi:hypothetical protein
MSYRRVLLIGAMRLTRVLHLHNDPHHSLGIAARWCWCQWDEKLSGNQLCLPPALSITWGFGEPVNLLLIVEDASWLVFLNWESNEPGFIPSGDTLRLFRTVFIASGQNCDRDSSPPLDQSMKNQFSEIAPGGHLWTGRNDRCPSRSLLIVSLR